MSEDKIDWKKVRARILTGPIFPMVKEVTASNKRRKKPETPEEIEQHRAKERERNKIYREQNPDKVHAREKKWRKENPEKVRAKKKRFYDAHKTDPEWMENHRRKNREYKQRRRMKKFNTQQKENHD